jgi:hypothetical protein
MTTPVFHARDFEGHVGEVFLIPDAVALTLSSVTRWGPEVGDGERQPFTLVLHGPREPVLPQSIYPFEHPAMDPFDLFIVPVGPDSRGMGYEAVFA